MTHRVVVILAAGASTRLGQPKAQLPCGGQTLLEHAIRTAAATNAAVWITQSESVPPNDAQVYSLSRASGGGPGRGPNQRSPTRILSIPNATEGMAASLRAAAQAALDDPGIEQLAVLPVDQYAVDARWLDALFDQAARYPGRYVASVHEGRRGAPAVFPRTRFPDLLALQGDAGARHLLRAAPEGAIVDWPAPWPPGDVDTVDDLAALAQWCSARGTGSVPAQPGGDQGRDIGS